MPHGAIGQELKFALVAGPARPSGGPEPRHPSQLYQAFLEGLVMFVVLWWFSRKPRPRYAVSGLFALLYGVFRIVAEFFRQPDAQFVTAENPLGLYLHLGGVGLTAGQLLSLPMIIAGLWVLARARQTPPQA